MPASLDLLTLACHAINLSAWAADLGLNPKTTGQARRRGALSAALAGALAIAVEEDPIKWVQVAAIEAERDQALRQRMLHAMHDKSKGAS